MKMLYNRELIQEAMKVLRPRDLYRGNSAGSVSCALLSAQGCASTWAVGSASAPSTAPSPP